MLFRSIVMARTVRGKFLEFFEESKRNPLTERIVLKGVKSRLIPAATGVQDNPEWLKLKWRNINERTVDG